MVTAIACSFLLFALKRGRTEQDQKISRPQTLKGWEDLQASPTQILLSSSGLAGSGKRAPCASTMTSFEVFLVFGKSPLNYISLKLT